MQTSTGSFSGTFLDRTTGKPRTYSGVVIQRENRGAGLFIGNGQVGAVELEPAP